MSLCMPKNQTVRILIVADGVIEQAAMWKLIYTD
jgi:hypothetical protein